MVFNSNTHYLNVMQEFQAGLSLADWGGTFPTAYVTDQANTLWDLGVRTVSCACPGWTSFVESSVIPSQRQYMEIFAAKGFNIDWGVIIPQQQNPTKINNWINNADPHVSWLQTLKNTYGIVCRWVVANENEASWNADQTTYGVQFQRVSNVVTVTFTEKHNLEVGWKFQIFSVGTFSAGVYTIGAIIDDYSFTYNNSGSDDLQTSVKINYIPETMCKIIARRAEHFKGISGIDLPMIARVSQGRYGPGQEYYRLMNTHNLNSSIDVIGLNIYGEGSTRAASLSDFKTYVTDAYNLLGSSRLEITEVGLYANDSDNTKVSRIESEYLSDWRERINHIESKSGLKHHLFAYKMPEGSNRMHLSMSKPVRYQYGNEHQPIFYEWLSRSVTSKMLWGWQDSANNFNYSLITSNLYKNPITLNTDGFLKIQGDIEGNAKLQSSNLSFSKTGKYAVMGMAKMLDMNFHPVNTLFSLGQSGVHGYRILIERQSGVDYLKFQDLKTFSVQSMRIPSDVSVHSFFHFAVTWKGNTSSWDKFFYINGRLLTTVQTNITFGNLVEKTNAQIQLGLDYGQENLYGYLSDVAFFNEFISANEVWNAIKNRSHARASSVWKLDEKTGNIAIDTVGENDLVVYQKAYLVTLASTQNSWYRKIMSRWYTKFR